MTPVLIGYFPRRTLRRGPDAPNIPDFIDDVCSVGCGSASPEGWIELWLHNEMWLYDSERLAWAVATDAASLQRLVPVVNQRYHEAFVQRVHALLPEHTPDQCGELLSAKMEEVQANLPPWWREVARESQTVIRDYLAKHTVLPGESFAEPSPWDLYAYRVFPVQYNGGAEEPLPLPPLEVDPLSGYYEFLGYDAVSREHGNDYGHSPLSPCCNGLLHKHRVNRHCLVDDAEEALRLARHFSDGRYTSPGTYSGPAEPGPYLVMEVHRRRPVP